LYQTETVFYTELILLTKRHHTVMQVAFLINKLRGVVFIHKEIFQMHFVLSANYPLHI